MLVAFGATAYLLAPELFNFRRRPPLAELAAIAAVAFFLPAFFEELVFRGLLMPRYSTFWVLLSGALFVAWHPFEAWLFLHDARSTFYRPDFLALVGLFAIASTWVSWRTRSLWASVFLHWAVVVGWRACGGARFLV
ncbi:MAG: CPBP family glutamic-type intramembrane protease [Pseudomonadota bacterium]